MDENPLVFLLAARCAHVNEADTCRKFVVPLLQAAGWDNDARPINEKMFFEHHVPCLREMLNDLLETHELDCELQFILSDALKAAPISRHGDLTEIVRN
jgi:hypothetical protein